MKTLVAKDPNERRHAFIQQGVSGTPAASGGLPFTLWHEKVDERFSCRVVLLAPPDCSARYPVVGV